LEALMIVGSREGLYLLSGTGDVIEPDDQILAIGSGGNFALAAARALVRSKQPDLDAEGIVRSSLQIASEICPYTNNSIHIETLSYG
ncbi:MAG: HslU--HslV peptidase proteolytic subunit, partial [Candidatus Dadabacteria bacterium]